MVKLNPILSQLLLGKKFHFINLNYGFSLHIYLESRQQKMHVASKYVLQE